MVRLSLDLIDSSPQAVNAAGKRELSLRGNHIEGLDNFSIVKDHFECIDFSDNGLVKVTSIPPLSKLKTLIFANNNLQRIGEGAFDGEES